MNSNPAKITTYQFRLSRDSTRFEFRRGSRILFHPSPHSFFRISLLKLFVSSIYPTSRLLSLSLLLSLARGEDSSHSRGIVGSIGIERGIGEEGLTQIASRFRCDWQGVGEILEDLTMPVYRTILGQTGINDVAVSSSSIIPFNDVISSSFDSPVSGLSYDRKIHKPSDYFR